MINNTVRWSRYDGLYGAGFHGNLFHENQFTDNGNSGIFFYGAESNNNITCNNLSNNMRSGIRIEDEGYNLVADNTISNNSEGAYLKMAWHNVLENNNITFNTYGIYINDSSQGNQVIGNRIESNTEGIVLTSGYVDDNNITGNYIISNTATGIRSVLSLHSHLDNDNNNPR